MNKNCLNQTVRELMIRVFSKTVVRMGEIYAGINGKKKNGFEFLQKSFKTC